MNKHHRTLELDRVLEMLAEQATCAASKELALRLEPCDNYRDACDALRRTADINTLTARYGTPGLGDGCKLGDGCELGDGCDVPKSLFISASRHTVSYWGEDVIQIGCKRYTISEWQKHFRIIGEAEGYSPEQMEEYKGYIDLIAAMHKTWALH